MPACRDCRTELEERTFGCPRCSPPIDPTALDGVERSPRWSEAQRFHIRSRRGTFQLGCAAVVVGALVLLWPSYSDAVARGDSSGTPLFWIGGLVAGVLAIFGVHYLRVPLQRHPAVVLATTFFTTTDSKGRSSTTYRVHLHARARPLTLHADHKQLAGLELGRTVIAFTRGQLLDAIWIVDGAALVSLPLPALPAHAPPAVDDAERHASAIATLADADPAAIQRVRATAITPPRSAFTTAAACLGLAAVLVVITAIVEHEGPSEGVDPEAAAARMRIIWIVVASLCGLMVAGAAASAWRASRRPVDRIAAVILGRRVVRSGDTLTPRLDIVDEQGRRYELPAAKTVPAPIGLPVVLFSFDRRVFAIRGISGA